MRLAGWAVFIAMSLSCGGCVTEAAPQTPREHFESLSGRGRPESIDDLLEARNVPGVSVAVIEDYQIAWSAGYGVADAVSGDPVTTDTLFQAASISKPVAAMAVVRAAQDGTFGLDDPINSLLTSWQLPENAFTAAQPVTPRRLLSHTAGTTVHGFPGYVPGEAIPTIIQILNGEAPANTEPVVVDTEPGTKCRYSGGGTTIMQLAMIDRYGKPFPEVVQSLVLDPAGMKHSRYDQPLSPERDATAARAHDGRGQAMGAKWHVYPELEAAGLWTTPEDLCRFAVAVMNAHRGTPDAILSQESAKEMLAPVEPGTFGIGLSLSERQDGAWAGHGGSNWGFRCELGFNIETGYGFCIMANSDAGGAVISALKQRLFAAYGWPEAD